MNAKLKLTLLSAAVSCAVLGAFSTATYAWFTVNKQAQFNHTAITVGSTARNISISCTTITPSENPRQTVVASGATETIEANAQITDVSSDFGRRYYAKDAVGAITSVQSNQLTGKVYQVGLAVTTKAITNTATVSIAINWDGMTSNANDRALVNYMRCAIIECETDQFVPANADEYKHIWCVEPETNNKFVTNEGEQTIDSEYLSAKGLYQQLFQYSGVETHYYLFSAWMEGTSAANQDDARGGSIAVRTIFSAS